MRHATELLRCSPAAWPYGPLTLGCLQRGSRRRHARANASGLMTGSPRLCTHRPGQFPRQNSLRTWKISLQRRTGHNGIERRRPCGRPCANREEPHLVLQQAAAGKRGGSTTCLPLKMRVDAREGSQVQPPAQSGQVKKKGRRCAVFDGAAGRRTLARWCVPSMSACPSTNQRADGGLGGPGTRQGKEEGSGLGPASQPTHYHQTARRDTSVSTSKTEPNAIYMGHASCFVSISVVWPLFLKGFRTPGFAKIKQLSGCGQRSRLGSRVISRDPPETIGPATGNKRRPGTKSITTGVNVEGRLRSCLLTVACLHGRVGESQLSRLQRRPSPRCNPFDRPSR